MADRGYVLSQLSAISNEGDRRILQRVFEHVLDNLSIGEPDHQTRATNFRMYFQKSTTASDTGVASFPHGLNYAPRLAIPVLDLNLAGSKLVPLEVAQVADSNRVYVKTTAGSTGAVFHLLIE